MRHVGTLALLASSAAAAGGAAWFARERLSHVRTGTCANPAVHAGSAAEAGRISRVAERLRRLWPEVTGNAEMPRAALEIALAQAFLESGIAEAGGGGWWKDKSSQGAGNMVGSGNLGARQCGANDAGGDYYTCVEYGDSRPNPDGTQTYFPAKFRYYKAGTVGGKQRDAGDAAAYEFLRDITHQWPALAELRSGDVLAYAMRQGPKYRGGDPPNQKVFGKEYKGGNGYYGGFGASMQDRVGGYARAIASHLPAIAAALGHDRIYACIPPEVASGGPTHAAVSGIGEAYMALHAVGALSRARAIPGSHGTAIVWYVEQAQGASKPMSAPVSGSEDTMKVNEIVSLLNAGASLPEPVSAPPVEGAGLTAAIAVTSAVTAAVVGAGVKHHLEQKAKKEEEQKATPKGPRISMPKKHPASSPSALPALDEDRGSLAALQPLMLPALEQDRGPIALPKVPAAAPMPPVTLPRTPAPAPVTLPALDPDRGSVAAIQSSKLTREDMKQMFPAYTDAQIDDALKEMHGAEPSLSGHLSPDMRDDLLRLMLVEARDASPADREHLLAIATDIGASDLDSLENELNKRETARRLATCGMGSQCDDMLRSACFYCGSTAGYAKCGNRECVRCGKPWFGPATISGEEHVTKEAAAESDAYMVAQHPSVEGAGKVAAIAAGVLAAGAGMTVVAKNAFDNLFVFDKKDELSMAESAKDLFTGSNTRKDRRAALEQTVSRHEVERLESRGLSASPKDIACAADVKKCPAKVEGVGTAVAVTAAGLAAGVGLAALLSKSAGAEEPAPVAPSAAPSPAPAPRAPAAPPAAPKPAAPKTMAEAPYPTPWGPYIPATDPSGRPVKGKLPSGTSFDKPTAGVGQPEYVPYPVPNSPTGVVWGPKLEGVASDLAPLLSLGAKADEPDDIDKALATGSDVTDVASGLMQAFAAGKKIAERGATKEDPKCRRLVKAWVEKHPILARLTSPDLRALSGINIGDADIETFKERYVNELLHQREAAGRHSSPLSDCTITPEEDRAVLLTLGARPSEFQVFTESLSHWAPDKVLPAAASAFKTAAPAVASMYRGGAGGGGLADLASLLPQQPERVARPPALPPEPVVVQKGVGIGVTAAIAAGAAAAAAIVVAIVAKK